MKKNMSIVKKVAAITLACAMALTVSPVMNAGAKSGNWYYRGVAEDDQTDSFKYLRGNWYYRGEGWETPATPEIDNTLKAIVERATVEYTDDWDYTPIALLAERENEGQDYKVFCRRTKTMPGAKSTYSILEIHTTFLEEAVISEMINTDIEAYGYLDPDDFMETDSPVISRYEGRIFEEAVGNIDGVNFKPLGLLATRKTNEMDYCFIAEMTKVSNNEVPTYALIYINVNDEGLVKFDGSKTVELI